MLPRDIQGESDVNLRRWADPRWGYWTSFDFLQCIRTMGQTIVGDFERHTHPRRKSRVLHPPQTLMEEFEGRINDSGQPVTSMTIPFTSLRGGWVQDADMKWHRLIVPSGHEQLIRSVYRPWRCAGRDEVLREASVQKASGALIQKLRRSSTL